MRRLGEIMEEMGFKKSSSEAVQKAFIRHLIHAANGTTVPAQEGPRGEQLAFDPQILGASERPRRNSAG